jgi:simple sugar transport system ATP-binding protein
MVIMRDGAKVGEIDDDLTEDHVMKVIAGGKENE